ncbi:glycosyltransferase [Kosmotoga pacifica]|nr:glycosyltransferase [Kosmotoga pacifica]
MYFPEIGGVESVAKVIAEIAARRGYDSYVITFSRSKHTSKENINGVHVIRCASIFCKDPIRISLKFIRCYEEFSKKSSIEIFHFPSGFPELICKKSKTNTKKYVFYHADVVSRNIKGYLFNYMVASPFLSTAGKIIATSPQMLRTSPLLNQFQNKSTIIPLFVDDKLFTPYGEFFDFTDYGLRVSSNMKLVLYVGRFGRYKGLEYLVKAFNLLPKQYLLILVGDGPLKPFIQKLIKHYDLNNRVFMLPHLKYFDLAKLYRTVDVFVLPSIDRGEAFGLVALEAMASGVPVITTILGTGTTFHNLHNKTGLHVPPMNSEALAEAIMKIIDENWKVSHHDVILKRAKEFSLNKFEKRILNTIFKI